MRNKAHKQRHASKREIAARQQGRVLEHQPSGAKVTKVQTKESRLQAANAMRKKKNEAVVAEKRLGSSQGPPRICGFIAANESANPAHAMQLFQTRMGCDVSTTNVPVSKASMTHRQRITFCADTECDIQASIDVAKVSDIVVLCLDVSQGLQQTLRDANAQRFEFEDDDGDAGTVATWYSHIGLCITDHTRELVSSLNAQGCPTVVVVLQGAGTYEHAKGRAKVVRLHTRYFASVLSDDLKVFAPETDDELDQVLRTIQTIKLRQLAWRDIRPYMVVEENAYDAANQKLTISGFLRGSCMGATDLIHLTNHGTYQIESIGCYKDPCPLRNTAVYPGELSVSAPEERTSLEATRPSDTVEDEGFPTEADVLHEEMQYEAKKNKVYIPEGVSEYQAAWYEFEGQPVFDDMPDAPEISAPAEDDPDAFGNFDTMSRKTIQDADLLRATDVLRLEKMTDDEKAEEIRRLKELSEEEQWNPDMIDTPIHLPARQRFSKYRGMKSFQTGKWDTAENLPLEYGHIYKLQGFKRIREAALEYSQNGEADVGMYVTIQIVDVPEQVASSLGEFTIASGLLQHEQRWSVLHFQVQRNKEDELPVKSKAPMLAHVGFRKFYCTPLYSDATVGDRTKFSRYFHTEDKFKLATFFGPISYSPCPVLFFKAPSIEEQAEGVPLQLSSFGSALPPNPDLLLLKRVVLSGRIAVIYRKVIVIKFMFFNDDDVRWFQPIDLYTKSGRRGKITKAIGAKGLFKAVFNDIVMQHDTVCMDLYKRVFPKWDTVAYSISDIQQLGGAPMDEE